MKISSSNEWDQLRSIIVGTANHANWPVHCPDFRKYEQTTLWKETPVPSGPVPDYIIQEANQDLDDLVKFLEGCGIKVYRPTDINFQKTDGMYNYCPRDRLLVVGNDIVDCPMSIGCRQQEDQAYDFLPQDWVLAQGRWDAANVCRLNDDLLYLKSESGDLEGYHWLCDYYANKQVHLVECYSGVHIDSTIVPVREGLVVLNAKRITEDTVPAPLKNWDKIWIHECVHQPFVDYPYASDWIGINFLVVDPSSVVCDPKQEYLRRELSKYNIESEGINLRHSRTLGGGHHCVTLDLCRE